MIGGMDAQDAVSLTRTLLRFDTINPPGRERDCARMAGAMLQDVGCKVDFHEFADSRTSCVARLGGNERKSPLCLTGPIDPVALGSRKWSKDPFSGETHGDKLYGRGASDWKAGVDTILNACRSFKNKLHGTAGIVVVLTAAEEGGCVGSQHLAKLPRLMGKAGAIVVGEPTSNFAYVGHKGSLKFQARYNGVSAHRSMPQLRQNGIYKVAKAESQHERFSFSSIKHPVMGKPTLNVGTIHGGDGINMVPDWAGFGVDIRTVPGQDHGKLISRLKKVLGKGAAMEMVSDLLPVWTEPDAEWVQRVFEICKPVLGKEPRPRSLTYMTDAANLLKVYKSAPTVVVGPGEAQMAHQTDEWGSVERIRESVSIYEEIIRDWCQS